MNHSRWSPEKIKSGASSQLTTQAKGVQDGMHHYYEELPALLKKLSKKLRCEFLKLGASGESQFVYELLQQVRKRASHLSRSSLLRPGRKGLTIVL